MNKKIAIQRVKRFAIDFGAFWLFCAVFYFLKKSYFSGQLAEIRFSAFSVISSAIIIYLAFLLGVRILKSRYWFFSLAWGTVALSYYQAISWGDSLSYKVGDILAFDDGEFTPFGFFYRMILLPQFFVALWASGLLVKQVFNRFKAGRLKNHFE